VVSGGAAATERAGRHPVIGPQVPLVISVEATHPNLRTIVAHTGVCVALRLSLWRSRYSSAGPFGYESGRPAWRGTGVVAPHLEARPVAVTRKRSTLELVAGVLKGASETTVCAGGGDAASHL